MARGNGTGPMGMGPMTGRGAGLCRGFSTPGYANTAKNFGGMGCGRGFSGKGFGRGFGRQYKAPKWSNQSNFMETKQDSKEYLSQQISFLENELKQTKEQLAYLESQETE